MPLRLLLDLFDFFWREEDPQGEINAWVVRSRGFVGQLILVGGSPRGAGIRGSPIVGLGAYRQPPQNGAYFSQLWRQQLNKEAVAPLKLHSRR